LGFPAGIRSFDANLSIVFSTFSVFTPSFWKMARPSSGTRQLRWIASYLAKFHSEATRWRRCETAGKLGQGRVIGIREKSSQTESESSYDGTNNQIESKDIRRKKFWVLKTASSEIWGFIWLRCVRTGSSEIVWR
jgi:hypothetical protein